MQENPYASPNTDVAAEPEIVAPEPVPQIDGNNPYLKPLFTCRKYVFLSLGSMILFGPVTAWVVDAIWSLGPTVPYTFFSNVLSGAALLMAVSWLALMAAILACWYYLFQAGRHHAGLGYALGHLASSIFLTPILLLGIIVVPLQVRGDVERAAESEDKTE